MDVRCDKCGTEYEFEDDRVTEQGVTVRCTECSHVFKVRRRTVAVTEPIAAAGEGGAGGEKAWMVRRENGDVYTFKELTTLQKWIVERKVTRADEISRSGETWKRLGNIAELATFFQVVEQAERAAGPVPLTNPTSGPATEPPAPEAGPPAPPPAAPAAEPPPPPAAAPVAPTPAAAPGPAVVSPPAAAPVPAAATVPAAAPPSAVAPPPAVAPPAAPAFAAPPAAVPPPAAPAPVAYVPPPPSYGPASGGLGAVSPAGDRTWQPPMNDPVGDLDDDDYGEFRRGGKGKWVFLVLVLLVGAGAGGFYYLRPAQFKALLHLGPKVPKTALAKVAQGKAALAPDTLAAYEAADADYQSALKLAGKAPYAAAEAGLAEADVRWALALREEANAAEAKAKKLGAALATAPTDAAAAKAAKALHDQVASLTNQANRLNQTAADKLDAAFTAAGKATTTAPNALSSTKAMIAYYVAEAAPSHLDPLLAKAAATKGAGADPDLAYLKGLALDVESAPPAKIEAALKHALSLDPHLTAARYALARVEARAKDVAGAEGDLHTVLTDSPSHARAKALLARLTAATKPAKAPAKAPAAKKPKPKAPAKVVEKKPRPKAHAPVGYDGLLSAAYRLRNNGSIQKALDLYGQARKLKPDRAEPYAGEGWCYMEMHAPAPAIASFSDALKRNSEYGDAIMGMAEAQKEEGNNKAAKKYYKRYLNLLPDGPDAAVAKTNLNSL